MWLVRSAKVETRGQGPSIEIDQRKGATSTSKRTEALPHPDHRTPEFITKFVVPSWIEHDPQNVPRIENSKSSSDRCFTEQQSPEESQYIMIRSLPKEGL